MRKERILVKFQNFCPKQGICYNNAVYMPWGTCDFASDPCRTYTSTNNTDTANTYCYAGYNLCLNRTQCDEITAKRSCPNNATLLTSLSPSNSCFVPASMTVRFTVLQQEGFQVLKFGSVPLDKSRIGLEIQLNRSTDNNSCVSPDALAMSSYVGAKTNLSWVKLKIRYLNGDGVVTECQPSYGILLPPKVRPATQAPLIRFKRNGTGYLYDYFNLNYIILPPANKTNASATDPCDILGVDTFPGTGNNAVRRQQCREVEKALYCYIDTPPSYTASYFGINSFWNAQPPSPFGSGYLLMSYGSAQVNTNLYQPGTVNVTCRTWNGYLPPPGTPPTDSNYFGDEVLKIEYSVLCQYGYELCLITRVCLPIGSPCRQRLNCTTMVGIPLCRCILLHCSIL